MAMWIQHNQSAAQTKTLVRSADRAALVVELSPDIAAGLRRVARQRNAAPEEVLQELLQRGLQHEQQRARTRTRLKTLTAREHQVAELAGDGSTNSEIAKTLVISPETVKTHIRHILTKLDLESKMELRLLLQD
jgi:DNA-binding NarL/FixJ family response regulator